MIELLTWRPDLCYIAPTAKGPGFYKDFPIMLLARLVCNKRVLHFHNKGVAERQDHMLDHLLYRIAFGGAHAILLSGLLRADVSKYISESRIHICPNGIPDTAMPPSADAAGSKGGRTRILFLSNLMVAKGVIVLLDACGALKNRGLQFECLFVGGEADVSREQFDEEVCARDLSAEVSYLGAKYGHDKNAILRSVDLVAFPTYNECFPLVLLEALCYSLPVVASNEGGIPDIVENGVSGYLVGKKDAQGLAKMLELLIVDRALRTSMGYEGRKRYKQHFTQLRFETRMRDILWSILADQAAEVASG
jgi:glycosyltransferase involved in cell wall biosynthesis